MQKLYMLEAPPGSDIPKHVTALTAAGTSVFAEGPPATAPPQAWLQMPPGVAASDRLLTTGNELIFSSKACAALMKCALDPQLLRCPLHVRGGEGSSPDSATHELWYSLAQHAVLHERARVRVFKGHVLSVHEWVLAADRLPGWDLFLGPTNRWLATERLVDAVFEHALSGFGFAVIPVV